MLRASLSPFLLSLWLATPARAESLTVGADFWCPFTCDPVQKKNGYIIDIATDILRAHGIKVDYQTMPWRRVLEQVKKNRLDVAAAGLKDEMKGLIITDLEVGKAELCVFTLESSKMQVKTPQDLEPYLLGAVVNGSYNDEVDAYVKKFKNDPKKIDYASGIEPHRTHIKKLAAGRIDAFLEDPNVIALEMKEHPETKLRNAGCFGKPLQLYFGISPKVPNAKAIKKYLDDGLIEMRKSGALEKILAKYGVKDWKNLK